MHGCVDKRIRKCLLCVLVLVCSRVASGTATEKYESLTSVQKVRQLSLREAGRAIVVRLEGVVTYYDAARRFGFIQDETGGVHFVGLHFTEGSPGFDWPLISAGDLLLVHGVTSRGNFSPFVGIVAHSEDPPLVTGKAPLPLPVHLPAYRLLNPGNHNEWCEVHAILTGIDGTEDHTIVSFNSGGLQYQATLPSGSTETEALKEWLYTEVRVQGVCGALFNDERQMVGLELFVPGVEFIEPVGAGATELFDQKPVSIQKLLRFRDQSPERVLVQGVVLLQLPRQGFFLRSAGKGLWVETDTRMSLRPGEQVKAVGQPAPGELRPYLQHAIIQTTALGERPEPHSVKPTQAFSPDVDGDLVRITARLVDRLDLPNGHTMLLQAGNTTFSARNPDKTLEWPQLVNGSWLELTGVCTVKAAGTWRPSDPDAPNRLSRLPASFTLLLGDASDIRVLHVPRWWTLERLAALAMGVALLAGLAFLWVALLRRRLRRQTALVVQTVERQTIQEERARIARDLHDTLQQNLTGIMHQINSISKRLLGPPDRMAESLDLASRMVQHSLKDVKCTIWNLRSEALHRADVNAVVEGALEPFLQQGGPRIHFSPFSLHCDLPGVTKHHLANIVREAISNAVQHAQANRIHVAVHANGSEFMIAIEDDGIGFDSNAVDATRGHFGLLGMRERIARMRGALQIQSQPNQGTCVTVTVPLPNS